MTEDGWVSTAFAHVVEEADVEGDPPDATDESGATSNGGALRPDREDLVERVLLTVRDIPPGRAMTYGDIGALVGCGPRRVGRILSTTEESVPWWRVTNASGVLPEPLCEKAFARYVEEETPVRGQRVVLAQARWRP